MQRRTQTTGLLLALAFAVVSFLPTVNVPAATLEIANRTTPLFLGRFGNWTIWEIERNEHRICYIVTGLEGELPANDFRPALIVTLKPGDENTPGQGQIKEVSVRSKKIALHQGRLEALIEPRTFPLFKRGEHAWLDSSLSSEADLLAAMRLGSTMTVQDVIGKHNFSERFSLNGFTKAEEAMVDLCMSPTNRT